MTTAIKWNTGMSVRELLDRHRGIGPGFHFLRYALASAIFVFHSYYVVKGQVGAVGYNDLLATTRTAASPMLANPQSTDLTSPIELLRPWLFALVAAFFAVSGFLVTGSAQRLRNVKTFLGFRVLRIIPALAVETLLSAFILGSLITTLEPGAYFSDGQFFRYFGNIVGAISMKLPGVFVDNPVPHIVNVNLWTLPGEFYCYLVMAGAMIAGLAYTRRGWLIVAIAGTIAFMVAIGLSLVTTRANTTHFTTPMIVYYFFVGCLFFQFADRIQLRFSYFLLSAAAYYAITLFRFPDLLAPVFLTYCAVFVGCQAYPLFDRLCPGDYSYGIYLYGFPMQQTVVFLFPEQRSTLFVLAAAGAATIVFAVLSWYTIEKPALKLKKLFVGKRIQVQTDASVIGVTTDPAPAYGRK